MTLFPALYLKTQTRRDVTVSIGDNATLFCQLSSDVVPKWQYRQNESADPTSVEDLMITDKLRAAYSRKKQDFSMVLTSAQPGDKGWYECVEFHGRGPRHVTVLNVTG
jgi:hypothetical protein